MNIAIFSGEVSGDLIGEALAREIYKRAPDAALWGIGSDGMRAAGVDLVADSAAWGAISITEALGKVPHLLLRVAPRLKRELRARKPDVVVLIDFGAFNMRAARYAHEQGLKVFYYFPPGAWRRTGPQSAEIARITDAIATPFEWSAERLRTVGANVTWVGHPILERVRPVLSRAEFAAQFGMDPARPIIGLLPGSRRHEVSHLMPTLLDAARLLYRKVPEAQFVVGVAPSISQTLMAGYLTHHTELRNHLGEIWHEFTKEAKKKVRNSVAGNLVSQGQRAMVTADGVVVPAETMELEMQARHRSEQIHARADRTLPPTVLVRGLTYDLMAHSDLLLTCSGTATLEAAVFGTPMVILYRGSKLMELEYKLRGIDKKIKHIGLPNILADRRIVPELIQEQATPEAIAELALPLLNDVAIRHQARQDLLSVRAFLGEPGASERTARLVLDLARRKPSKP